ncbi:MAG TPA: hypothetical protein VFW80_01595 [Gaiellaceae bacterium]|nr:hypothetical protein [Gaiellaceae bacterium]
MGWLGNFWGRRRRSATDDKEEMVKAHGQQSGEDDASVADELEEEAHEARDEQALREPRIGPGTG